MGALSSGRCSTIEFNRQSCLLVSDLLRSLTLEELFALALDASRRREAGHVLAYLKESAKRADVSAQALFMLGSEYAQIGMKPEAKAAMARAVERGPDFPFARFQLGMLHATTNETEAAKAVWQPLTELRPEHPQAYLSTLQRGMRHLLSEEFDAAIQVLREGIAQNQENAPLNAEMRRIIDAVEHLPGRVSAAVVDPMPAAAEMPPAAAADIPAAEPDSDPSHLFISAYTQSGKPH